MLVRSETADLLVNQRSQQPQTEEYVSVMDIILFIVAFQISHAEIVLNPL